MAIQMITVEFEVENAADLHEQALCAVMRRATEYTTADAERLLGPAESPNLRACLVECMGLTKIPGASVLDVW